MAIMYQFHCTILTKLDKVGKKLIRYGFTIGYEI